MRITIRQRRHGRRAFSLVDLIVIVVLIGLLIALWVPAVAITRDRSDRQACLYRLHRVGAAIQQYRSNYNNAFPRMTVDPHRPVDLTNGGAAATNPFAKDGPPNNNVPAAFFLLVRTEMLTPATVTCPGGKFEPDPNAEIDPTIRSNFTDVRRNMGYSFTVDYPARSGGGGYVGIAIAADVNPGVAGPGDDALVPRGAPPDQLRKGNSNSHRKRGQNVLYADGQVRWVETPYAGVNGDNIYTTGDGKVVGWQKDVSDSVLLPTDD